MMVDDQNLDIKNPLSQRDAPNISAAIAKDGSVPETSSIYIAEEVKQTKRHLSHFKLIIIFLVVSTILAITTLVLLLEWFRKSSDTKPTIILEEVNFYPSLSPSSAVLMCGDGIVGNGVCKNSTLCCSKWGYCGSSDEHCGITKAPVPVPTVPTAPPLNDSRFVAYVGNWQTCPTFEQYENYTHIVIAYAVSYTWAPGKNLCSYICAIGTPPICGNSLNAGLVKTWQNSGKKVMISFGGAGMGGTWRGDVNDCWEYCFGREKDIVERLTEIVTSLSLDGVEINYLYFTEDGQYGSNFTKGAIAQTFLKDLTLGLRNSLPPGSLISHSVKDAHLISESAYFSLLSNISSSIDFLMVGYFNGYARPVLDGIEGIGQGTISTLSHYKTLVDNIFQSDPTKVVFGFCISECDSTNSSATGLEASIVMTNLSHHYSCNGGAYFWVAKHDVKGMWSSQLSPVLQKNAGCSNGSI